MPWLKIEVGQRRGSNPASFPCRSHLELGSDNVPEFQFEHPSDLICAMGMKMHQSCRDISSRAAMASVFMGQAHLPGGGSSDVENRTDPAELRWSAILTSQMAPGTIKHACNLNPCQSWLFINRRFSR